MLEGQAPEVRVSVDDVLVKHARRHGSKYPRRSSSRKRPIVGYGYVKRGNVSNGCAGVCGQSDDTVVRWIEHRVKGHVAKVPLVSYAVTAAETCLAVAVHVPGKTDAWSEVVPVRLPESTNRAAGGSLEASAADPLCKGRARTIVKVS